MRRKLLKTLCLCALSCFAAGTFGVSLRANAEEYSKNAEELIASSGFNVTYNVAGNEAQEGLTNDTAKGILFQTEQTGAAAKGASLTFENSLSGLFELNFRAFTEVKDTSGSWWDGGAWYDRTNSEELREMAITVTDEETGEKFTVYVKGGTEWNAYTPNARVAYGAAGEYYGSGRWYTNYSDNNGYQNNDKGLSNTTYNTAIFGTSFVNRARNDGGEIAGGGYSTNIGFDPVSKEVYAYVYGKAEKYQCYKRVILDLDDAEDFSYLTQTSGGKRDGEVGAAFQKSTFKKYNVQVSVTDVTEGKSAAFLIYHLNGQSLGGEGGKIVSSVAPGAAVETPEGKMYREYTLPQPVLRGVLGESPEFTGTVEVKAPGGTTVFAETEYVSGLKFTPEEYGEYTLIYRGIVSLSGAGRKTFAAGAVYSGAELSYEYPFTVKKSNLVTGNAAELITTNGFSVTYNVAGNEAQEGLTNDTAKGILFQTEQTGAAAKGASLMFKNSLSGLFELNFRAFTEVKDTSGSWWDGGAWYDRTNSEELREMAITVTDEETGEKFTVYVKGGTEWNAYTPNARVAYGAAGEYYGSGRWYTNYSDNNGYQNNDKGLSNTTYNTAIFGTSFVNRARNDGGEIAGGGYSTNIGFDPVSKEVYAYVYGKAEKYQCYKRVILDLDDAEDFSYLTQTSGGKRDGEVGAAFQKSTFKKYNVQVSVTDVTEGKSAAFLIYHLNGQSLGGEGGLLESDGGYGMYLAPFGKRFVGMKDVLPAPYASSVLTGEKPFEGTVRVTDNEGNEVLPLQQWNGNVTFTPEAAGMYFAEYGGMTDENDFTAREFSFGAYPGGERVLRMPIVVETEAAEIPRYKEVLRGMSVEFGAKPKEKGLKTYLTVQKNGTPIAGCEMLEIGENYAYTFSENGEYSLIYTIKNAVGGSSKIVASVRAVGLKGHIINENTLVALGRDFLLKKSDFKVYSALGEINDFSLSAEIYNETAGAWQNAGRLDSAADVGQFFNLKETFLKLGEGDYSVRFVIEKEEDSLTLERVYTLKDCYAPQLDAGEVKLNGAKEDVAKSGESGKYFVTTQGNKILLPVVVSTDDIDGEIAVQITVKKPGEEVGAPAAAQSELIFDRLGLYVVVYTATDRSGNSAAYALFIEVRKICLEAEIPDQTAELKQSFVPAAPDVFEALTGEKIQSPAYEVRVYLGGAEIAKENDSFVLQYVGEFVLEYTVTYAQAKQTFTAKLTVCDTVAPEIELNGEYQSTASIGDTIEIVSAEIYDAGVCELICEVYIGNTKVAVENGRFTIDRHGVYVVRYTATDTSGNETVKEYAITVPAPEEEKKGCNGSLGGNAAAISSVTATLCATIVVVSKKRKHNGGAR